MEVSRGRGKNVILSFLGRSDQSPFATLDVHFCAAYSQTSPARSGGGGEEESGGVYDRRDRPASGRRLCATPMRTYSRHHASRQGRRRHARRAYRDASSATRRSHPARIRSDRLTCIYAVEDVTAPRLVGSSSHVLCVEIKPKWGFPTADRLASAQLAKRRNQGTLLEVSHAPRG